MHLDELLSLPQSNWTNSSRLHAFRLRRRQFVQPGHAHRDGYARSHPQSDPGPIGCDYILAGSDHGEQSHGRFAQWTRAVFNHHEGVRLEGGPLTPSPSNPIHVDVYGALSGVILPPSTTIPSGSNVTFTYSGASFPNNISINAWMTDPGTGGAAIGVTQVLMQNTSSCVYGTTSYQVPLTQTLPDALQVMADVGDSLSSAPAALTTYTIDTGSLGALVPSSELPHDSNVIGPAGPGVKVYNSSGNTYSGNYYLARVSVHIQGGTVVQTIPIVVLGINKAYCTGPSTKPCHKNPPSPTLHYLGVGFTSTATALRPETCSTRRPPT